MHVRSLVTGVFLLALSAQALAQSDIERATAREAASSGLSAFQAGHYGEAADSFSRAEQLVHAPTHLLYLARSQAKLGKLIAARENYLKIEREVLAPNAPKAFSDAKTAAEAERGAVEARVAYVTINVRGSATHELSITMDGTKLPGAIVGMAMPVDPGQHVFQASEPGNESPATTVALSEGAKQAVMLALIPSATPTVHSSTVSERAPTTPSPTPLDTAASKHPLRAAAYVAFGVGAVGLGGGALFILKSAATRRDADTLYNACNAESAPRLCSDPAQESSINAKDSDADGQRNLGVGGVVVGSLGVATGVTLLLLDARRTRPAEGRAVRVIPIVGARSLGVAGAF